jgi:LysR family nod box-dependent transcriptional activator
MDLARVDLNLLVAFDALMDERSVTRAASRLSLSQPGMSNTLARLRKLFGDPLLVREGPTLVPTPRADALRQPVHDALAIIRVALDQRTGFDPAADQATWTVSCSDYSLLMLIGPLVRRLAAAAPGVTIRVLPRAPDPVGLLRESTADLVIEPAEIMPDAQLRLGHLVYSMGRGQPASIVDQHLERSRVPRRIEFTVESFLLAPFLLEGTDLVTVVPERAVPHLRRTAAIRVLEPPVPLPAITEMLWWHPRHTANPAHAWIRGRIAEIAAELDHGAATRRAADDPPPGADV